VIKAVIFDFDGTIVNSMDNLADIAAEVIYSNFGLSKEMARELYLKTSGLPFYQQIEIIFPGNSKNKRVVENFETIKKRDFESHLLYDDAEETLIYLKSKGYITVVSSNNFQDIIEEYLKRHNIEFDSILGFGNGLAKGSSHIDYLISKFGLKREEILMVGDSLKDGELALDNGIGFIGKTGINTKQNFIDSFTDIRVIESLIDIKKYL